MFGKSRGIKNVTVDVKTAAATFGKNIAFVFQHLVTLFT